VRGLGTLSKHSIKKDVIVSSKANLVCIQETKSQASNYFQLLSILPPSKFTNFESLDAHNTQWRGYSSIGQHITYLWITFTLQIIYS
jgi:hypothetical protein